MPFPATSCSCPEQPTLGPHPYLPRRHCGQTPSTPEHDFHSLHALPSPHTHPLILPPTHPQTGASSGPVWWRAQEVRCTLQYLGDSRESGAATEPACSRQPARLPACLPAPAALPAQPACSNLCLLPRLPNLATYSMTNRLPSSTHDAAPTTPHPPSPFSLMPSACPGWPTTLLPPLPLRPQNSLPTLSQ